jgi:cytidylate kinase
MKIPDITIAVDGFSSTGKSTLARLIAQRFDFLYLDSGAMYRGVTLFAQEQGLISPDNVIDPALEAALEGLDLHFAQGTVLYMGERNIEKQIRSMEVSAQVSPIAAVPYVRRYVDRRLHEFSAAGRVVMDGRDIGTTVFPNAEIKVFMTARPEVRAQRRFDELAGKGENPVFEEVLKNLEERDYIDSHRETSPLRRAEDAFVLDNSEMGLTDEVAWAEGLIRGKFLLLDAPDAPAND